MSCNYLAPNNEQSLLYDGLSQFLGPTKAAQTWNYTRSNEFAAKYNEVELDSNGEPTVQWTMDNLNLQPVNTVKPPILIDESSFSKLPDAASYQDVMGALTRLGEIARENPDNVYYFQMGDFDVNGNMSAMPTKTDFATWADAIADAMYMGLLPSNVTLGTSMQQAVANIAGANSVIVEGGDFKAPESVKILNRALLEIQRRAMYIPISDAQGKPTGQYMTAEQQQAVMDSVMYQLVRILNSDDNAKALPTMARIMSQFESVKKAFYMRAKDKKTGNATVDAVSVEDALVRYGLMNDIINSWPAVMKSFEQYAAFFGIDLNLPGGNKLTAGSYDIRDAIQNISESEADMDLYVKELQDREGWQDVSVEIDPMDTASGRIKMFLSTIELSEITPDGQLVTGTNMLGLPQVYDLEDIFEETMKTLADMPSNITATTVNEEGETVQTQYGKGGENFLQLLRDSGRPSLIRLAARLTTASEQIRREFVKVFSKHHHTFKMVLFEKTSNGIKARPIDTNQASATQMIVNQWQQGQKKAPIVMEASDGSLVINRELAFDLLAKLRDKGYDRKKLAREILDAHGIVMPEVALNLLLNNTRGATSNTVYNGSDLNDLFAVTQQGEPLGPFSALVTPMVKDSFNTDEVELSSEDDGRVTPLKVNNPMYNESKGLRFLADLTAEHSKRLYSSSFRSIDGKSTWAYSMNSYEAVTFRQLLSDPVMRDQYSKDVYARKAWLLPQFAAGNLTLEYMGGVRNERGSDYGAPRDQMSEREQLATSLWLFQNKGLNTTTLMDQTKADKSKRSPIVSNIQRVLIPNFRTLTPVALGHVANTVRSEMDRIQKVLSAEQQGTPFTDAAYNRGGKYFYLTPEFNFDYLAVLVAKGVISNEEMGQIWHDRGQLNTEAMGTPSQNAAMKKVIDWMVDDMTTSTLNDWLKAGITSTSNIDQVTYDKDYLRKIMNTYGLVRNGKDFARLTSEQETPGQPKPSRKIPTVEALEMINRHAALDYALHYYLFNASMSQLISGDPAQNYKVKVSSEDVTNDFQRVAVTLVNYVKRLAKDVAPGQDPTWTNGPTEQFQALSLSDVKTAATYLAKYDKAYNDITSTDAQELTTVREHLYVQYAMGLVPERIYNEMTAIIDKGMKEDNGYYEFKKPEHLAIVMQPMKPVYVGSRYENNSRFMDYIKSSSYPLYPPMTKNSELEGLRMVMEGKVTSKGLEGHIARAHFASAKKVGLPIDMQSAFDSQGKFTGVKTLPTTLTREGFRIQQEVPYDESKEMIRIVSQANKLLVEGLQGNPNLHFTIPGYDGTFTGPEIAQLKEDTRIKMFDKAYKDFASKIGARLDDTGAMIIEEQSKVIGTLLEEATSRDYPINDIVSLMMRNKDGTLNIPLLFNSSSDKFESLLMAINKKVAIIKMPGKSYVQGSPTGHRAIKKLSELTDAERGGIVYTQLWDEASKSYKTYDPTKPLKGMDMVDGKVQAARVLLPFSFLENGKPMDINQFTKVDDNGNRVIDPEKLSPSLLRLLGFRIPNQGHNSMMPIEIAGFLPANMGDLMIVPDTVTVQMGSDFDVDKLYVYRLPYTRYEDGSYDIDEADEAVVDYFNIHWSILTHPEIFPRVIAPLDKPDLKEEADFLSRIMAEKTDLPRRQFQGTSQILDYMAQKDAKGLVGLTSLTSTFNALVQSKSITLAKRSMDGWEATTFTGFRDEFSGNIIHAAEISGYGTSLYAEDDGDRSTASLRTKGDNIASQQSEAVDYANNRVIDRINLNSFTYKASAAISLLQDNKGNAYSIKYNTRLLTQPIIWDYASRMASGNDQLSENVTSDLESKVINELGAEYKEKAIMSLIKEGKTEDQANKIVQDYLNTDESYTPQMMLDVLKGPRNSQFYMDQIQLLNIFAQLDEIGQEIMTIQGMINQDTKGAGPSILHAINQQKRVAEKQGSTLQGWRSLLENENGELTEIGNLANKTTNTVPQVYNALLPYGKIFNLYESINQQIGRKLSVDGMRDVTKHFRSYIYSYAMEVMGVTDPHKERIRLLYTTRDSKSLPARIQDLARQLPNNVLLARIQTQMADRRGQPDRLYIQAAQLTRADEYTVVRDWMDMLTGVQGEEAQQVAEDLVRYVFVTGGRSDVRSLARFVPASYLASIGFGSKLGSVDFTNVPNGFLYQWMQHNPQAARHIPDDVKTGETFVTPSIAGIIAGVQPQYSDLLVQTEVDGQRLPSFPIFVSQYDANNSVWKLFVKTDDGLDGSAIYSRVDTLGQKGIVEYNYQAENVNRSVFAENRVLEMPIVVSDTNIRSTEAPQTFFTRWFPEINYSEEKLVLRIRELLNGKEFSTNYAAAIELFANVASPMAEGNANLLQQMEAYLNSLKTGMADFYLEDLSTGITLDVSDLTDEKGRPRTEVGGNYHSIDQRINLNDLYYLSMNRQQSSEVVAHEFSHHFTATVINIWEVIKSLAARKGDPTIAENFLGKFPQLSQHLLELDRLFQQARRAYLETIPEVDRASIEEFWADDDAKKWPKAGSERMNYLLRNTAEFSVGATSNVEMIQFLNGVKDTESSLLSKILDSFVGVLKAIAAAFGVEVAPGSNLEGTLKTISGMMSLTVTPEFNSDTNTWVTEDPNRMENMKDQGFQVTRADFKVYHMAAPAPAMSVSDKGIVDRSIKRLQEQRREILDRMTNLTDPAVYARKQAVLEMTDDAIRELKTTSNPDVLRTIAEKQIAFVDKVLADPNASVNDVMMAWKLTDAWINMGDLLFPDAQAVINTITPPDYVKGLEEEARLRRASLLNLKMQSLFTNQSTIGLTSKDFNLELVDISTPSLLMRSADHAKAKLTQQVALFLQNAGRRRDEAILRYVREDLAKLDTKMEKARKARGLSKTQFYNQFFQENEDETAWGVVQQYSYDWYSQDKTLRRELESAVRYINNKTWQDQQQYKAALDNAWGKFHRAKAQQSFTIPVHEIFDAAGAQLVTDFSGPLRDASGKLVPNAQSKAVYQRLEADFGKAKADGFIAEAQAKYKEYLQDKDAHDADIDVAVLDGRLTNTEGIAAKAAWVATNSPEVYSRARYQTTNQANNLSIIPVDALSYVVEIPKKDYQNGVFYDKKYEQVQANPELKSIHSDITEIMARFTNMLPLYMQREIGPNFLPIVQRELITEMTSVAGMKNWLSDTVINALTASPYEDGKVATQQRTIPVNYVSTAENQTYTTQDEMAARQEEITGRSRDITRLLELFGMSALHYKHFSAVRDVVEMGQTLLTEINAQRKLALQTRYQNGKVVDNEKALDNTLKSLNYTMDALMYKRARDLEMPLNVKLYSLNPIKQAKISRSVKTLERELIELEKTKNTMSQQEYDDQKKEIQAKLAQYEGRNMYASKAGDVLMTITQLKALAYNPFSAAANLSFGIVSAMTHANGRVDFDHKAFWKAFSMVVQHSSRKSMFMGAWQSPTAKKIFNILEKTGVMAEIVDSQYGKSNIPDMKEKWKTKLSPYQMMRTSDYFMRALNTVSFMIHQQVEVTLPDGTKSQVTAWEAFDDNGDYKYQDAEWNGADETQRHKWEAFRNRAIRINSIIMGNMDRNSPVWTKKFMLGRLISQFRLSWLGEGMATRFEHEKYDAQLGRIVKGRWRTYGDLGAGGFFLTVGKQLLSLIPGMKINPFDVQMRDGRNMTSSPVDVENMRRNFAELGFGVTLLIAIAMLKWSKEDDDENKAKLQLVINMLTRTEQDMWFYASPDAFNTVFNRAVPAVNTLNDYQKAMSAAYRVITDDKYKWEQFVLAMTRAGLPIPQAALYNKIKYMTERDLASINN